MQVESRGKKAKSFRTDAANAPWYSRTRGRNSICFPNSSSQLFRIFQKVTARIRYRSRSCHKQSMYLPYSPVCMQLTITTLRTRTRNPASPAPHWYILQSRRSVVIRCGSWPLLLSCGVTLSLVASSGTYTHLRSRGLANTLLLLLLLLLG